LGYWLFTLFFRAAEKIRLGCAARFLKMKKESTLEPKIGETIQHYYTEYTGYELLCVEGDPYYRCKGCFFFKRSDCDYYGRCMPETRSDGKNVIFIKTKRIDKNRKQRIKKRKRDVKVVKENKCNRKCLFTGVCKVGLCANIQIKQTKKQA
jgi:hypothetical protein